MKTRKPSYEVVGVAVCSTKSLLNYRVSAKFCRNGFPFLLKKRNIKAIPLILIPEYGQSNQTLESRLRKTADVRFVLQT